MKIKISKVDGLKNYLVENYLYIWGIYCQQGLSGYIKYKNTKILYSCTKNQSAEFICIFQNFPTHHH
jgi:hypothetical protein